MMATMRKRLFLWLIFVILAITWIFGTLIHFNGRITKETASEISAMYMSEMMYQLRDHFSSIIRFKTREANYIVEHVVLEQLEDPREYLIESAQRFSFDYLAFYDSAGNHETIMGKSAWYRNLAGFMQQVQAGEIVATTGYLTSGTEKYLVFGVPIQCEMACGTTAEVLLLGFNVEKLYDHIHIDKAEGIGYETKLDIVLTNGSYVIHQQAENDASYFEHIRQYGSFVGAETAEGIAQIEKAMAGDKSFSHTVTLNGVTKHIYGAPAVNPGDWYFVLSMPQGVVDNLIGRQDTVRLRVFGAAGLCIAGLFLMVFLFYMYMSKKQMKETERARNEAVIANNAKSSFLSNMSHDIRTPMNAIAGFAVMAEDSIKQGKQEDALAAISKLKRSSEYLRNLIGDVLDMSKIESGMLTLMPEAVSLYEMVETVDTIAKVRTEMKDQQYELRVHDVLHDAILCDRTRLEQVLINLIGNAVKFTNDNGRVIFEVWQEASDRGADFVRTSFTVEDTGIGMSERFMSTLFQSFTREESRVRKIEGTGLGLAISKRLVDMMEGRIDVVSREGAGSRFCVTVDLPRAGERFSAAGHAVAGIEPDSVRILMAEDNDFNHEVARALLEGHGFAVSRAEDGGEAVEMYCASPETWDLILMDLRMPVMDGYEATRKIRAFEAGQGSDMHIPIFALSADVFEEDIKQCISAGMEGHVSKPIDMSELMRKVNKHLKRASEKTDPACGR